MYHQELLTLIILHRCIVFFSRSVKFHFQLKKIFKKIKSLDFLIQKFFPFFLLKFNVTVNIQRRHAAAGNSLFK